MQNTLESNIERDGAEPHHFLSLKRDKSYVALREMSHIIAIDAFAKWQPTIPGNGVRSIDAIIVGRPEMVSIYDALCRLPTHETLVIIKT